MRTLRGHRLPWISPLAAYLVAGAIALLGAPAAHAQSPRVAPLPSGPRFLVTLGASRNAVPLDVRTAPALNRRLVLDLENASVKDALAAITEQSGMRLVYAEDVLGATGRVSLKAEGITTAAALTDVLADADVDLVFSPSGDEAVLVQRAPLRARRQVGTIVGRVTDTTNHAPIIGVTVTLEGTRLGAATGDNGQYEIRDVPPGRYTVDARRLGYTRATQTVTVVADQQATVDFALTPAASQLDQVIVTATNQTQRARESGANVAVLTVDSLPKAPINNFSDVLSSRVAGVSVDQSSGTTGTGSEIRIRGNTSISLDNSPLIIVDGVRVDNFQGNNTAFYIGVGNQEPSRLNDINPDDIANIEVIKGPAASALYGTASANGVIRITTKRGAEGPPRFMAFYETGGLHEAIKDIPPNYAQPGVAPGGGGAVPSCSILAQALGACTPSGSLVTYNPTETYSPFRAGHRDNFGMNVSGGGNATTYYLSGTYEREQGVYETNRLRNITGRANLHTDLGDKLDVSVSTGYLDNRLSLPLNDNFGGELGGLLGPAYDDPVTHGFPFGTPAELNQIHNTEYLRHFTGSGTGNYRPLSWLTFTGTAGLDFIDQLDATLVENGTLDRSVLGGLFPADGVRSASPYEFFNYTADGSATARYGILPSLTGTTTLGAQYARNSFHGVVANGQDLTPGTGSLSGVNTARTVNEHSQAIVTVGYLAQEQLAWRDRLFLTGGVRTDQNSAFGTNFKRVYYPAASLSWVVSDEPFFPRTDILSSLRLRTAWGESGQNPQFRQALTFYNPTTVALGVSDVAGVTIGGAGNSNLKPELTKEFEAGFDASFLQDRITTELTYYHKLTSDALVQQSLPPSLGTGQAFSRFVNLGQVRNTGFELLLNAKVLDTRSVGVDLTVTGTTTNNKVVNLGQGISPIIVLFGTERIETGLPLGAYTQPKILGFADKNGDGMIEPNELTLTDTSVYLGTPDPTREVSIRPTVTLFRYVRVSSLFDYRGGNKLFDFTEAYRCFASETCRGIQDRSAPLAEQANAVAAATGESFAGFIEDASFWKLREASITLDAPASWLRSARVSGLSLTLAGRNLATWTKYKGFDPEVNALGQETNAYKVELATQPPVRYYTARINVTW